MYKHGFFIYFFFTSSGVAQLMTVQCHEVSSTRLCINIPHCVCWNLKTRMSRFKFRISEVSQGMAEIFLFILAIKVMKYATVLSEGILTFSFFWKFFNLQV